MSARLHVEFKNISHQKTRIIDEIFTSRQTAEEYVEQLKFHGWDIVKAEVKEV